MKDQFEVIDDCFQIVVLHHPIQIQLGNSLMIYCHTGRIQCQTAAIIETSSNCLKSGDFATIKLIPLEPVCVEKFHEYPSLGYFAIRHMNQMVAVGIIKDVQWQ